jgi:HAD superfamily hydrolase (TIGR01490 family)
METSKYIVFLDLDGTVTSVNSGYALVRTARTRKLIGLRGISNALILSMVYRLQLFPAGEIINSMGRWLRGIRSDILSEVALTAVENFLKGSVYEDALKEIEYHKSQNAALALLSSAVSEICRPMADYLGVHYIICTEMEKVNGFLTGCPESDYCFGPEKKERLHTFCENNGFNLSKAYYYADSCSDLEALESVGNPICVNPDKRLKKTALERNWQIRSWKSGISKK